jgi:hypothetical protein
LDICHGLNLSIGNSASRRPGQLRSAWPGGLTNKVCVVLALPCRNQTAAERLYGITGQTTSQ